MKIHFHSWLIKAMTSDDRPCYLQCLHGAPRGAPYAANESFLDGELRILSPLGNTLVVQSATVYRNPISGQRYTSSDPEAP